ncbi:hypothetical protein PROVRUST_08042 [Providencia rustigianii DSM 4541]|uniref:Uncharacterized protein n=1 Tax=Providencia rustigianii DSM 4541 TaxID=500637 RepID=D1P722_9GAMM|nr:hypothetical protein PROVRUST_08042 [Providencia rustigianii DSM 4541]
MINFFIYILECLFITFGYLFQNEIICFKLNSFKIQSINFVFIRLLWLKYNH